MTAERMRPGQGPLYRQVKQRVIRNLIDEVWKPGDMLPSEPRLAAAYTNLGLALAFGGDSRGAIEAYTRALELRANDAKAHAGLGAAYASLDRFDEAIRGFFVAYLSVCR